MVNLFDNERLRSFLPISLYGIGDANSFSALIKEIQNEEAIIIWENDRPIRVIKVARVEITIGNLTLWESNQVFKDGRSRKRNIRGISEKFFCGETPLQAAVRGVKEELGLVDTQPQYIRVAEDEKESGSYPGLITRYKFWDYNLGLNISQFKSSYIADEGEATTYFEWRERSDG